MPGSPHDLPVHIGPGDIVAVQIGDQVYTDTIESITGHPVRPDPVSHAHHQLAQILDLTTALTDRNDEA